jgi:hypothetical protein
MDVTLTGRTISVPAAAPAGNYTLTGKAGVPNTPALQVTDSFPFVKFGATWVEDFEDGMAQNFDWTIGPSSSVSIDGGYAKINTINEASSWTSGAYTGDTYTSYVYTTTFDFMTNGGNSVGVLFNGNGTQDGDYAGYGLYLSNGYWSAWVYTAGIETNLVGWTPSGAIQQGPGAINMLAITSNAGTFDISCNGTYIGSFSDATYPSGMIGLASYVGNETWDEAMTVNAVAAPMVAGNVDVGQPVAQLRDVTGAVITDPSKFYTPGVAFDRSAEFTGTPINFDPADWTGSDIAFTGETATVGLPTQYAMNAAYPNPFNPSTTVAIALPQASELTVSVFNVMGQKVASLASGKYSAGQHTFSFDGAGLASGLYFIQAKVPGQLNSVQKVTLMK